MSELYDIIAAESFSSDERDARVFAALRYYRSRPDLALSDTGGAEIPRRLASSE